MTQTTIKSGLASLLIITAGTITYADAKFSDHINMRTVQYVAERLFFCHHQPAEKTISLYEIREDGIESSLATESSSTIQTVYTYSSPPSSVLSSFSFSSQLLTLSEYYLEVESFSKKKKPIPHDTPPEMPVFGNMPYSLAQLFYPVNFLQQTMIIKTRKANDD